MGFNNVYSLLLLQTHPDQTHVLVGCIEVILSSVKEVWSMTIKCL